jgi:hypothetical protein
MTAHLSMPSSTVPHRDSPGLHRDRHAAVLTARPPAPPDKPLASRRGAVGADRPVGRPDQPRDDRRHAYARALRRRGARPSRASCPDGAVPRATPGRKTGGLAGTSESFQAHPDPRGQAEKAWLSGSDVPGAPVFAHVVPDRCSHEHETLSNSNLRGFGVSVSRSRPHRDSRSVRTTRRRRPRPSRL